MTLESLNRWERIASIAAFVLGIGGIACGIYIFLNSVSIWSIALCILSALNIGWGAARLSDLFELDKKQERERIEGMIKENSLRLDHIIAQASPSPPLSENAYGNMEEIQLDNPNPQSASNNANEGQVATPFPIAVPPFQSRVDRDVVG